MKYSYSRLFLLTPKFTDPPIVDFKRIAVTHTLYTLFQNKCSKYWADEVHPSLDYPTDVGTIRVEFKKCDDFQVYCLREFVVSRDGQVRLWLLIAEVADSFFFFFFFFKTKAHFQKLFYVFEFWILKSLMAGWLERASLRWNVLSWSGGHELEPQSGRTWNVSVELLS